MPEKWVASVESDPHAENYGYGDIEPSPSPTPAAYQTPVVAPVKTQIKDLPYGTPVPGKSGLVKSPWSDQGLVDVNGMPPGIEAKCPYSGKVFLVP